MVHCKAVSPAELKIRVTCLVGCIVALRRSTFVCPQSNEGTSVMALMNRALCLLHHQIQHVDSTYVLRIKFVLLRGLLSVVGAAV